MQRWTPWLAAALALPLLFGCEPLEDENSGQRADARPPVGQQDAAVSADQGTTPRLDAGSDPLDATPTTDLGHTLDLGDPDGEPPQNDADVAFELGEFVRVEPGTYTRGGGIETTHEVQLTRAFEMQATEVTHAQWRALVGGTASAFPSCGGQCPVDQVSWLQAIDYTNRLSEHQGLPPCYDAEGEVIGAPTAYECTGYRLPTDAEWEYALRAGSSNPTPWPRGELDQHAWYGNNAGGRPEPVATLEANPWGFYDMLGNVREWVHDRYARFESDPLVDPAGPEAGDERVSRGGYFLSSPADMDATHREARPPERRGEQGFRPARTIFE